MCFRPSRIDDEKRRARGSDIWFQIMPFVVKFRKKSVTFPMMLQARSQFHPGWEISILSDGNSMSEITATVGGHLLEGRIAVSEIPISLHGNLLSFLQVTKNESLLAGNQDLARQCQEFIDQLHLSDVRPSTAMIRTWGGSRLPSISAYRDSTNSQLSQTMRTQTELEASNRFWDLELVRFNEDRQAATKDLLNRHTEAELESHRTWVQPDRFEVPSAEQLRSRAAVTAKEEDKKALLARADRVDEMEYDYRQMRSSADLARTLACLKRRQGEERAVFERRWNRQRGVVEREMKAEIDPKAIAVDRSGACSRSSPLRTERVLFRKTCPVSILESIKIKIPLL
jgi:hypothetical protein